MHTFKRFSTLQKIAVSGLTVVPLVAAVGRAGTSEHPAADVVAGAQQACPSATQIRGDLSAPLSHVRFLADDALGGREVGSPGAACAADYIVSFFEDSGLEPAGPDGSWFQTFQVRAGATLGAGNGFSVTGADYTVGEDWIPYAFAPSGHVSAPLAYSSSDVPSDAQHEAVGPDVTGKIVVVDDAAPGTGGLTGDPHFRAANAAERGAVGLVVLLADSAKLPDPGTENRPSVKIPVIAVSREAAGAVREAARAGAEAALVVDVAPRMVEARNVLGLLEGGDHQHSREIVVVGAHYDHLGLGGEGSLSPDEYGVVHNGADDNASGTAALLEVAAALGARSERPARSVLFMAFTGEEKGLLGSSHYVKEPVFPLERTVAMINMDMVGRLREDRLTVYGIGTAEEWEDLVVGLNAQRSDPFQLILTPDGYGPSDQAAFYGEGIPVLHFFTNTHEDYHRPTDDWDRIDGEGIARIADFAADVAVELAGEAAQPERLASLTPVAGAGNPHGASLPTSDQPSSGSGYGPFLGTIPDMTPQDFGVRLTGVRDDSPAQKAGLRSGDVIVEFGGKEVADLYAYTYALRDHSPGDEVEIVVLRDGERVTVTALLEARR